MANSQEKQPLLNNKSKSDGCQNVQRTPHYTSETVWITRPEARAVIVTDITLEEIDDLEHQDIDSDLESPNHITGSLVVIKNATFLQVLGVAMVIIAGMCFTGSNSIQKFVLPEVTFWQLLATRASIQIVIIGATCCIMHFKSRSGK